MSIIVNDLRDCSATPLCDMAADEIERLERELAEANRALAEAIRERDTARLEVAKGVSAFQHEEAASGVCQVQRDLAMAQNAALRVSVGALVEALKVMVDAFDHGHGLPEIVQARAALSQAQENAK